MNKNYNEFECTYVQYCKCLCCHFWRIRFILLRIQILVPITYSGLTVTGRACTMCTAFIRAILCHISPSESHTEPLGCCFSVVARKVTKSDYVLPSAPSRPNKVTSLSHPSLCPSSPSIYSSFLTQSVCLSSPSPYSSFLTQLVCLSSLFPPSCSFLFPFLSSVWGPVFLPLMINSQYKESGRE